MIFRIEERRLLTMTWTSPFLRFSSSMAVFRIIDEYPKHEVPAEPKERELWYNLLSL